MGGKTWNLCVRVCVFAKLDSQGWRMEREKVLMGGVGGLLKWVK